MKYFKAVIEETRRKTVFIQVPDDGDKDLAISQINAGMIGGDLSEEENEKLAFNDYDRNLDYDENHITYIEEADMEKEQEYAEMYYEFPECVFWDKNWNCITKGWCD